MVITEPAELTAIYREVVNYPVPNEAAVSLNDQILTVTSRWSQRDLERIEKTTLERSHSIDLTKLQVLSQTGPTEIKNEVWNKLSPSGKLRAVVRNGKDKKNEDKQFLEIFDSSRKLKTIDLLALEKHGKVIENDGQFGSFEWSASEGHILYMAEKKKPKKGSFFDPKAYRDVSIGDDDQLPPEKPDDVARGDEFEFEETWGEQLVERVQPVICILDIESNTVSILENFPEDVSPGQAMWSSDDAGVVVCGWFSVPYKLGLKFCSQRKSYLYYLDIQSGAIEILSEEGRAVRYPRFNNDRSKLVYLDGPIGGPHNHCARLMKIDWATRERSVVVGEIANAPASDFPGIYTYAVSRYVWFDDNINLALETAWRSEGAVIVVNTSTGAVTRVKKDSEKGSLGLLCVFNNVLVLYGSSPNQPFHLLLAQVQDPTNLSKLQWLYPDGDPETLDWLTWSVHKHKPVEERIHPVYSTLDYESILCLPKQTGNDSLPPLIVFSHGGPNTVFDTSFMPITSFFCCCGYAVLQVNYRGSTGFGEDGVRSLIGNIGTQDVQDVESAMVETVAGGNVDGNNIFAFGGSHGGFLTTHLIGQYPDTFNAAASRNPVINLVSMYSTTDIPDWCMAQAGAPFKHKMLCDDKYLKQMWRASPLSYVDLVKTPMLLMIGQADQRVPPTQGLEYYKALKARDVPVRFLTYPKNNHGISEVDAEADCMMNTVLWFGKYMDPNHSKQRVSFITVS